jgi:hypothetical protein
MESLSRQNDRKRNRLLVLRFTNDLRHNRPTLKNHLSKGFKMTSKTINSIGYSYIESWVTDTSKFGKPDKEAMQAWIQDAELGGFEFDSIIEMSKFMTKTRQTETLFIPSQFFTIEEIH